jgi:uncharacterized protein (TIGR02466 family)
MRVELLFPSAMARNEHPEFVDAAKTVLAEHIARVKPNTWNVCQSESMFDERLEGLLSLIARESFQMLYDQGYDMTHAQTSVADFWGQEFLMHGQHMEHIHSRGAQITGFYFVDVPENSALPLLFDPRPGKRQISLLPTNQANVTYASEQVVIGVGPGDLVLFNSWLPHGFTRHESNKPFRFIHFNVTVENHAMSCPTVEVI